MDMTTTATARPDDVPFSRPNANHAPVGEVVARGCDLGLADMPPELLVCIAEKLDRPRDLVAAQIASSLFARAPLDQFVGRRYAGRLRALIEAGAPVGAVRVAIAHDRRALSPSLIHPAVRYGDVSVLDALCQALFDPHRDQTAPADDGLVHAPGRPAHAITQDRLLNALWCAVQYGRVDALRYLTAHDTPLGQCGRSWVDGGLLIAAVGHNSVAIVACLHRLLAPDEAAPCRCTRAVGEAAWNALTPDVALWLRDARCAGYVKPRSFHISKAISRGHAAHVARMVEAYADPRVLDDGTDGKDAAAVLPPAAVPAVGRAVSRAAAAGNMAMMDVATRSLCRDAFPIVVGAARGGRADLLTWATAPDGPCVAALGMPTTEMMRTAAAAAVLSDRPSSLHWMACHFPGAITPVLLWTAVSSGAAGAFDTLCHLVEGPIAWTGLLGEAMASGSLAVVRLLVEEKHVDIDPLCVISWGLGSDDVADYVCQRLANDQLQTIVDIAGSHANPSDSRRKLLKRVRNRVPHLCLAAHYAAEGAACGDPYSEPMDVCACSKCADPHGAVSASPASSAKRLRVDASQEAPPPPTDP